MKCINLATVVTLGLVTLGANHVEGRVGGKNENSPSPKTHPNSNVSRVLQSQKGSKFAIATSGSCESNGLETIVDATDCRAAASENGNTVVWDGTPYSYQDVVDGCSIRFGGQLFLNNPGVCKLGSWTPNYVPPHNNLARCECSVFQPCLCKRKPLPVCETSKFQPDTTKYYTISTEDGLFWAQGSPGRSALNWMSKQNTPGMRMYLTTDKIGAASHWRFVAGSRGKWSVQNRLTGLKVGYDKDWRLTTNLQAAAIELTATCNSAKNKLFLQLEGVANAFARCDINGCTNGSNINLVERQKYQTASTGCVAHSSCSKKLGSDWYKISSTDYFFFSSYSCARYVDVPSQKAEQWWSIEEVEDFVKRDLTEPVLVTVKEHALESLGNEIALVGDILLEQPPVVGSIFGFARSEYFSGPTIAEQLQKLADDVQEMTSDMISTGVATYAIDEANKRLAARRKYFLVEYPGHKHKYIADSDSAQLDDLADSLLSEARQYEVDMTTYFGTDYSPTPMNAKRAQKGFQYIKVAMVEALTMHQEGLLLQAYTHPEYECEDLVGRYQIREKATQYKQQLQDTWSMLLNRRASGTVIGASFNQKMYTCEAHDDFAGRTELFYFSGGGAASVFGTAQQVSRALQAELKHDMTYLSYPTKAQIDYFTSYEAKTLTMCGAIRSDPEFRARFESD